MGDSMNLYIDREAMERRGSIPVLGSLHCRDRRIRGGREKSSTRTVTLLRETSSEDTPHGRLAISNYTEGDIERVSSHSTCFTNDDETSSSFLTHYKKIFVPNRLRRRRRSSSSSLQSMSMSLSSLPREIELRSDEERTNKNSSSTNSVWDKRTTSIEVWLQRKFFNIVDKEKVERMKQKEDLKS